MEAPMILLIIALIMAPALILGGYPPSNCCPNKYPFLPAPPGQTPPCSKNGATYCEKIETYPVETIRYLLYKWGTTYSQFIRTELDQDFIMMTQNYSFYPKYPSTHYGEQTTHYLYNSSYNSPSYLPQGPPQFQQQQQYQPTHQQQLTDHYHAAAAAAILPPLIHSFWWNHRDRSTNRRTYPYLPQTPAHTRFHRYKRQTTSENQLCRISSRFTVPQAAMNNEGNWMYVVNMEGTRYVQQVRAEECEGPPGAACDGVCSIPPGFSASCRQKYVQKRLVALAETGERLQQQVFWFPHCCVCEVVRA